jgi:hypothetical protein
VRGKPDRVDEVEAELEKGLHLHHHLGRIANGRCSPPRLPARARRHPRGYHLPPLPRRRPQRRHHHRRRPHPPPRLRHRRAAPDRLRLAAPLRPRAPTPAGAPSAAPASPTAPPPPSSSTSSRSGSTSKTSTGKNKAAKASKHSPSSPASSSGPPSSPPSHERSGATSAADRLPSSQPSTHNRAHLQTIRRSRAYDEGLADPDERARPQNFTALPDRRGSHSPIVAGSPRRGRARRR